MFEALEDYRFSRRQAQRASQARPLFAALYSLDMGRSWLPAYGADLTPGGFKLLCHGTIREGEIPMRLSLDSRTLDVRARQVWHTSGELKGADVQEYGVEILTLGTAGRDVITEWLDREAIVQAEEAPETELLRIDPDDVSKLIPAEFQHRVIQALIRSGRLAPDRSGRYPTLTYGYGGVAKHDGRPMHQFIVHSRVIRGTDVYSYATRVSVDESGTNLFFERAASAA